MPTAAPTQDLLATHDASSIWQIHRSTVIAVFATFLASSGIALGIGLLLLRRHKRIAARLRASAESLSFAVADAGIGMWQYDIGTRHLRASNHCLSLLGLPLRSSPTLETLFQAVHPDDHSLAVAWIRAATRGALSNGDSEFRVVNAGGAVRWVQAKHFTSWNEQRVPTRISGIIQDITDIRETSEQAKGLALLVLNIQEKERENISLELHDSTAQHLAAISLNLVALRGLSRFSRPIEKILDDIDGSLEEAIKELRTFTYLLYPPALAEDGFTATVRRYAEGFSRRTQIYVAVNASVRSDELSLPLQRSLLRVIQEALANVHRHARASRASVGLRHIADHVHLVISDNGRGQPPRVRADRRESERPPTGVGIAGMTARVQHFGGRLHIRSRSTGTIVHVVIPTAVVESAFPNAASSRHAVELAS